MAKVRKSLFIGTGAVAVLLVAALLGVSWYYSGEIEKGGLKVDKKPPDQNLEVVRIEGGTIELRRATGSPKLDEPGLVGLEGPSGYARVGRVIELTQDTVVREYIPLTGTVSAGERVRFDRDAYPGDPKSAFGLDFTEVSIQSLIGPLPAWQTVGEDDTWVILVHGRRAGRDETLRALKVVADAGLPALAISYRNDPGTLNDPSGYYQFGLTEWVDVEAAANYALAHGAKDLVVIGFSMGGGVTASFLYNSPVSDRVAGVVFDAPMLDFGETIDLAARQRNLPGIVASIAKWLAARRYGVDWRAMNYLVRAKEIKAPVLVFHGDKDPTVPFSISQRLAAQRPDLVRFVPVHGAVHVGSWNVDPARYEQELHDFLVRVSR